MQVLHVCKSTSTSAMLLMCQSSQEGCLCNLTVQWIKHVHPGQLGTSFLRRKKQDLFSGTDRKWMIPIQFAYVYHTIPQTAWINVRISVFLGKNSPSTSHTCEVHDAPKVFHQKDVKVQATHSLVKRLDVAMGVLIIGWEANRVKMMG